MITENEAPFIHIEENLDPGDAPDTFETADLFLAIAALAFFAMQVFIWTR